MSSTDGSPTMTGWKRRSSAASFSMCLRYSSSVVAPTARSSPRASIGLSRLAASTAPSAAPAPTIVCSSSMNRMTWPSASAISFRTAFSRSSNSPRYFEPAISAPMSSATTRRSRSDSGTSPATIRWARPSTIAVLPTPGSPIRTGLFLVRRRQHLDDAADLVVAADDRVELARLGGLGQVAPELLQRLVLVLGVLVGDAVRAAHLGQRLAAARRGWRRRRAAPRRPGLGLREREQQVLGRDVLVVELAGLLLGGAQDGDELGPRARPSPPSPRVGSASSAALTSARIGCRPAPSLRSTGTTTPPSCSSRTASRCSGVTCGLRRSSASAARPGAPPGT